MSKFTKAFIEASCWIAIALLVGGLPVWQAMGVIVATCILACKNYSDGSAFSERVWRGYADDVVAMWRDKYWKAIGIPTPPTKD